MHCASARERLWPPERPRLAEADVLAATAHVEACDACRAYTAQDRRLLDLDAALRECGAPDALRERVFDVLVRERAAFAASAASAGAARPAAI